ncbi:thiosulfate oxidation carrier protein SoxY [Arcobacter sp. 15-2]|uniref:thiosulfate oxidation carrier protein SoxY n=1 Tax=Arcobacter sp. 15-2 TaxID=3374109 RepID=UPI00399C82FD
MNRRKFLGLGLGLGAAAVMLPSTLSAVNFRETNKSAFEGPKSHTVDDAMKELYGTSKTTVGKVKLKAPDIAENGAVVPLQVSSDLAGKTVAIFQDANPESLVAVYTVPADGIIDYKLRIKMAKTGTVTAVVQDGTTLFSASKMVKVTAGGCGG